MNWSGKFVHGVCCLFVAAALVLSPRDARAFEIFGISLFGEDEQIPEGHLTYSVRFEITPSSEALEEGLKGASILEHLQPKGVVNSSALIARAEADKPRLVAALFANARYGGTVGIRIAGRPLEDIVPGTQLGTPGKIVPVVIAVDAGRPFVFGRVQIRQPPADGPDGLSSDPADYGLGRGEPARSSLILAAEERLTDGWRRRGHPFAETTSRDVVADHATGRLDVVLTVNPGPDADFGEVIIEGAEDVDPYFVRDQTAIRTSSRYTPEAIDDAGERLRRLGVFESVRVNEGAKEDFDGTLPVTVAISERKPRFIGATVGWSSIDGAEVEAYWGHRNLFGRAERLRLGVAVTQIDTLSVGDLTYRAEASFVKPGISDIDTDLFADVTLQREHPDAYRSETATAMIGLRHRFSKTLTGSIAVEGEVASVNDTFGTNEYVLKGLPATLTYDTRDSPLDATRGVRAHLLVEPFYETERSTAFVLAKTDLSAYQSLDDTARLVAAGRLSAGSFIGADIDDIPAGRRFFAGGGGSIRGYAYRNVGPRSATGDVIGGRSIVEASAELRFRVTETVGIVPFLDAGAVSTELYPGSDTKFKLGAGIGLRYFTALGPIRFDFAVPFDPESGDDEFAIYAGLGQTF